MPQMEVSNGSAQSSLELLWICRTSCHQMWPIVSLPGTSWSNIMHHTAHPALCYLFVYLCWDRPGGFLHLCLLTQSPSASPWAFCWCYLTLSFAPRWLLLPYAITLSQVLITRNNSFQHQLPPKIITEPLTSYNDCMLSYNYCWHQLML